MTKGNTGALTELQAIAAEALGALNIGGQNITGFDFSPNVKIPLFQLPTRLGKDRCVRVGFRSSGQNGNRNRRFLGMDSCDCHPGSLIRILPLRYREPHRNSNSGERNQYDSSSWQ